MAKDELDRIMSETWETYNNSITQTSDDVKQFNAI